MKKKYGPKILMTTCILLFLLVKIQSQSVKPFKDARNLYGLKDSKGKIILTPQYNYINDINDGLARVRTGADYNSSLYGFIDSTGTVIIPVKYPYADGFSEGLVYAELDKKFGFLDKKGKTVIPFTYDGASFFSEGLAAVRTGDYTTGKWSYINKTGKTVLAASYDAAGAFKDGLALVSIQGKYGFINPSGKQLIPAEYDYAYGFSDNGLAAVNKGGVKGGLSVKGGKWGYIDKSGKPVIPLQYDHADPFAEGLACVMQDKKAGYIDKTGKLIIPMIYETMSSFQYGKAPVTVNGRSFFIDKTGKESKSSRRVNFNNGEYTGEVAKDGITPDGYGKMVWTKDEIYEGDWVNGKMTGKGKLTSKGKVYEGNFLNGALIDAGKNNADAGKLTGRWKNTESLFDPVYVFRTNKSGVTELTTDLYDTGFFSLKNGNEIEFYTTNILSAEKRMYKGKIAADFNVITGNIVTEKGDMITTFKLERVKETTPGFSYILNEEFNDNKNNWPVGSNNDAITQIANGQYVFEMKNPYYYFNWMPGTILSTLNQSKDFTMETEITVLSGDENYPAWFLWAHKDMSTQYYFNIIPTGSYEYGKKINNTVSVLIPPTASSAIKKGKNVVNKITIKKKSNSIEFYINDTLVNSAAYEKFDPLTTVGFLLQNQKKIAVNYVRIFQQN